MSSGSSRPTLTRRQSGFLLVALLGSLALAVFWLTQLLQPRRPGAMAAPPTSAERPPAKPPASDASGAGGAPPAKKPAPEVELTERLAALDAVPSATLAEQRLRLFERLEQEAGLDKAALQRVREIFEASPVLGQGNPELTEPPMSRSECLERRRAARRQFAASSTCGAANMVPVYGPPADARTARLCVDQFEFPNLLCEYPVVHVSSREAALVCEAVGKRLCDAHEWEGACAGELRPISDEYTFDKPRPLATWLHNEQREIVWAYGAKKQHEICGTESSKASGCVGGFRTCSTNSYPTGAFPECVSRFGVYDQHGNAAEHMNLPLEPAELGSRGGYGATEMKGSWFIFSIMEAHPDDCRWRAKDWHPSRVMALDSHRNYHLGFRCCRDI